MPYLTWLADVLRAAGLPVREVPGWRTRGHGPMGNILGVLGHHTAGAATGLYPSERIVVHGRPGLEGPLAQLGLDRAGTWIVIAAGRAWHAGTGSIGWCPANRGNDHLIGVEAESVGTRDDWTPAQRANYPRGVAAILRHLGLGSYRVIGHKEWAPTRKIDPAFWDMNAFRAQVARLMHAPPEEDELDANQARMLQTIFDQITGNNFAGWPTWGGGTGEKLTPVDYLRRNNVEVRQLHHNMTSLHSKLDALLKRPVGEVDPAPIVEAIVRAGIAEQVVDALAARLTQPPTP